ncbi:hypothetical protein AHAS_Ahas01G0094700 [Arachis hypogaea]
MPLLSYLSLAATCSTTSVADLLFEAGGSLCPARLCGRYQIDRIEKEERITAQRSRRPSHSQLLLRQRNAIRRGLHKEDSRVLLGRYRTPKRFEN